MKVYLIIILTACVASSGCIKKCDCLLKTECSLNSVSPSLRNGLIAYYPFCGNANDMSENQNHGAVSGATLTTDRFGNANSAFSFNGDNNKITVQDNQALNPTKLSVSLWFKTNDNSKRQYLLYKSNWTNAANEEYAFGINYQKPGETVAGIKRNSLCKAADGWQRAFINQSLNQDWHHYVFTYDGATAKVYLDGLLISSTAISGPIDVCPGGTLTIGAGWSGDAGWWNGKIDDVMMHNRALSENEIQELYNK